MKIVTGIQMQALDRRTILEARVPSLILMERAGIGLADFIQNRFGPLRGKRVTVVCGKGNNALVSGEGVTNHCPGAVMLYGAVEHKTLTSLSDCS